MYIANLKQRLPLKYVECIEKIPVINHKSLNTLISIKR